MSKTDKFLKLLRDSGVSEYWCSPGFNPELQYPVARILIPVENYDLACKIMNMYNNDDEDDESMLTVYPHSKGTKLFNIVSSTLERRTV